MLEEVEEYVVGISCCAQAFTKDEYIINFNVNETMINEQDFENIVESTGSNQPVTWSLV